MINKKSQVSMFIIIGIILLIIVGVYFALQSAKISEESIIEEVPVELQPIKSYVESCIAQIGEDAVYLIGQQGGYYEVPQMDPDYFSTTAYYFWINENIMPSQEKVEAEISKYVDKELNYCLKNFEDFKNFEIEQEESKTKTHMKDNEIIFNVNLPLTVKKDESVTKLSSFSNSISNVRLKTVYDTAKAVIDEQMEDFHSICLSCIINWSIEKDLRVEMQRLNEDGVLFTIIDNNSVIDGLDYEYIFANKYEQFGCDNPPPDADDDFYAECLQVDYSLEIEEIPDLTAVVGKQLVYDINATGIDVKFYDFTTLFYINEDGLIYYLTKKEDIGNYTIWIKATDKLGNEDFTSFGLEVKYE